MTTSSPAPSRSDTALRVYRFEVRPRDGQRDVIGEAIARDAAALGVGTLGVRSAHVYLMEGTLTREQQARVAQALLADPVTESCVQGAAPARDGSRLIEVHPLPGVMDPVAQSVEEGVRELIGVRVSASTGWRYDVQGASAEQAGVLAQRLLANPVIHRVVSEPLHPARFPTPAAHEHEVRSIPLINLDDGALVRLSREAHLFLSLDEMKAIQSEYRRLGREPRDIELETLAQTWSEHCVHKTLKSTVRYSERRVASGESGRVGSGEWRVGEEKSGEEKKACGTRHEARAEKQSEARAEALSWRGRPGVAVQPDGSVVIHNLLKSTVAAATHELIAQGVDWTLSVFKDNSGVIALDEKFGVCIKVETHNHPSAIEPYGGAATGIGGCIRDVIGTGLGAQPIAATDVFCVAHPTGWGETRPLPPGTLHPARVLSQVVAGVRDYGNRMGIPTVSGGVFFDDRYVGNPLVYCGCVGLIPRHLVHGKVRAGDRIIALGGRTGRDGIHGATFSSAELEHTAADEFAHAVQIGNAIEEKRTLDAIMRARDAQGGPLFSAMTDCGAGGFSSAIGEMGREVGASVHLERAPLKYPGLSYTEIWISEAQERMVLAVPADHVAALRAICDEEHVEMADLGEFGTAEADLVLHYHGREVGRLNMHFLHEGIPMPTREAVWEGGRVASGEWGVGEEKKGVETCAGVHLKDVLLKMLAHPTIASKQWIIRQYDHEVRGATVLKPLVGPRGRGPGDASVIEAVAGTGRGIALACGLQTPLGDPRVGGDPYLMALAAIDECVRNLVCAGADPERIAILDNFCWPSCAAPRNMGTLVRACVGCYDGAKAYRTPFVSGKDSLNNQLKYVDPASGEERVIEIPPTLLITGMGIVPDVRACVTSDVKVPGNVLVLVGTTHRAMGGSMLQAMMGSVEDSSIPRVELDTGPRAARFVAGLIARGVVKAAHDLSEGGLLVAAAEMLIGASGSGRPIGARVDLARVDEAGGLCAAFSETPSRYLIEVGPRDVPMVIEGARASGVTALAVGEVNDSGLLSDPEQRLSVVVGDLASAWGAG